MGETPSRRAFFGSAVGAGFAATLPPVFTVAATSALAAACTKAVGHMQWLDLAENCEHLTDEELNAALDISRDAFDLAIREPSAGLGDLRAKAMMALDDLDRFHPETLDDKAPPRLLRTILREVMALSA